MDPIQKKIIDALKPFGLPISETLYEGTEKEFFSYVISLDTAADHGDNRPQAYVASIQVHYVCPWNDIYADMKRLIRKALIFAGCTAPEVVDMSDPKDRIRHLIFECELENEYDLEV